jgi:glycosyltransferase involved in cell wall biosynthesis
MALKKVLMIVDNPTGERFGGGTAFVANGICENNDRLVKYGYITEIFNTQRINRSKKSMGKVKIENFINAFKLVVDLKKQLNSEEYNIIHFHSSIKFSLLRDLLVIQKIRNKFYGKIVLHIHYADKENILFNERYDKLVIMKLFKNVDKVIFLSEKTKEQFLQAGLAENKCAVVYNFHLVNTCNETVDRKFSALNTEHKRNLLFLGSIDKRKGIIELLTALTGVNKDYFIFNICGTVTDISVENKFYELVDSMKDNVVLQGYVSGEKKNKILNETDILILPSYGEGLPISILEAMASGCSIISTNVGAIPEIIKDKVNGYIIKPGDIESLRERINTLLTSKTHLKEVIKENYTYSKQFSIGNFIKNISNIYDTL